MNTKKHFNTDEIKKANTKYEFSGGQPFFRKKSRWNKKVNIDDSLAIHPRLVHIALDHIRQGAVKGR
jgi:hypothetical protein